MKLFEILKKTKEFWQPLMGYMDQSGAVVIEPQFADMTLRNGAAQFSTTGYAIVKRPNETQSLIINTRGETVFEFPKNHEPSPFPGVVDSTGVFGVEHRIDGDNPDNWTLDGRDYFFTGTSRHYAMRFDGSVLFEGKLKGCCHGHYLYSDEQSLGAKMGLRDPNGEIVIPPIYDHIFPSKTDPVLTVLRANQSEVLRLDGSKVFSSPMSHVQLTNLRAVVDGYWIVPNAQSGRADVMDINTGARIGELSMSYWSGSIPRACPTLAGGVVSVSDAEKGTGYFYPDGSPVMPGILKRPRWFPAEMRTGYFSEGRASFKLNDTWGYMDLTGAHVIPPQFRSDASFRDGLARVKYPSDGKSWKRFSYVDRAGQTVWHQED